MGFFLISLKGKFNVFLNPLFRTNVSTSMNVGKNLKRGVESVGDLINLSSLVKLEGGGRGLPEGFKSYEQKM